MTFDTFTELKSAAIECIAYDKNGDKMSPTARSRTKGTDGPSHKAKYILQTK